MSYFISRQIDFGRPIFLSRSEFGICITAKREDATALHTIGEAREFVADAIQDFDDMLIAWRKVDTITLGSQYIAIFRTASCLRAVTFFIHRQKE